MPINILYLESEDECEFSHEFIFVFVNFSEGDDGDFDHVEQVQLQPYDKIMLSVIYYLKERAFVDKDLYKRLLVLKTNISKDFRDCWSFSHENDVCQVGSTKGFRCGK